MNSDGRNPKCPLSTTHVLGFVQLSSKDKIKMSNLWAQHDTIAELKHRDIVTCMCVNAIRTILQFTLVTHGHLFRVRLGATNIYPYTSPYIPIVTHNILIIIVLLCRCGPYMYRYVFPWTIWRVPYLSSNQKLLQMQEYTHMLMQISTGSPPYVHYNAPMPHARKQVLNLCPIETMNIIVFLLALRQSLSTDKGSYHMEAPLVCTIHGANLIIHIMSLYPFGPPAIPNENIRRCPRGQWTNPYSNSRGHATKRGLRVPNPNSRGHATKRGLRVPNPNSMGHATKRGFRDCPGFLNSTGRLGPKRGRKCYVTPAFLGIPKQRGTKSEVKTSARGHHDAPRGP